MTSSVLNKGPRKFGVKKRAKQIQSLPSASSVGSYTASLAAKEAQNFASAEDCRVTVSEQISQPSTVEVDTVEDTVDGVIAAHPAQSAKPILIDRPSHFRVKQPPKLFSSLDDICEKAECKDDSENMAEKQTDTDTNSFEEKSRSDIIQEMSLASLIASSFDEGELSVDEKKARKRLRDARSGRLQSKVTPKDENESVSSAKCFTTTDLARRASVASTMTMGSNFSASYAEQEGDVSESLTAPIARPQLVLVDGQLVIDQSSLTVMREPDYNEAECGMGLPFVQDEAEVKHTTSASYGKKVKSQRWTKEETKNLYEGLSLFGTDFEMIRMVVFPYRSRAQVKKKFNKEERSNHHRIMFALSRRIKFSSAEHGHFAGSHSLISALES